MTGTGHPGHAAETVQVDRDERGVHLTTASGSCDLAVAPNFALARHFTSRARRRELVEIVLQGDDGYGMVTATWHRLPHRRTVPLAAALALAMVGVPARLLRETAS